MNFSLFCLQNCKDHDQKRIGKRVHDVPCQSVMTQNSTNVLVFPDGISSRGVKRKVHAKTYGHRPTKKMKMVCKDDRQLDGKLLEKMDVLATSSKELDGKQSHAVYERGGHPEKRNPNNNNRDGTCSSTGSNSPHTVADQNLAVDTCSHAENMSAELHRIEIQAYRTTLRALYASGSFSWPQELLLTDLRICLHISDDEHRHELRYLKYFS